MKKILIGFITVLLCNGLYAQGIKFEHGQFEDVLKKAKQENKMVFVDFYTQWCGPCKQLAKTLFKDPKVGAFYNKHFVCYKIDAEDKSMNGPAIAQRYKVKAYPTLIYMDADGKVASKRTGGCDAELFIKAAKKAMGQDVSSNVDKYYQKYEEGDHSDENLLKLANGLEQYLTLDEKGEMSKEEAWGLLTKVRDEFCKGSLDKFFDPKNFKVLYDIYNFKGGTRDDSVIIWLIKNYDELAQKVDEKDLSSLITIANYQSVQVAAMKFDKELYKKYANDVDGCLKAAYDFYGERQKSRKLLLASGKTAYHLAKREYGRYLKSYKKSLKYYSDLSAINYLTPHRTILRMNNKSPKGVEKYLRRAISLVKIAYKKHYNAYVSTDLGKIYAQLGDKETARKYYNEALEVFRGQNNDKAMQRIERFTREMHELGL
jgi:thiol-disulfide isomerase/thioredoxin